MLGSRGFHEPKRRTFGESLIALLMHLVGTAVVFVALFTLIWLAAWFLAWLQGIRPLSEDVMRPIHYFEMGALYLDEGVCAIMLLAGARRFCRELLEIGP